MTINPPQDLDDAPARGPAAANAFAALPPSPRREYVSWIEGAKRPDTRARRVERTLARLLRSDPKGA